MSQESREKLKTGSLEEVFDVLCRRSALQWPKGVKAIGDIVEIPFVTEYRSTEDADQAEQNLLAYGYSPQRQDRKIFLKDNFSIAEVRKLAKANSVFTSIVEEIDKISPRRSPGTREEALAFLVDFINCVTKGISISFYRARGNNYNNQEEWQYSKEYPFKHVEENYNTVNWPQSLVPSLLEVAKDVVDQINALVDILNTTRDNLVYKRTMNKLVYFLKPKSGPNFIYSEPEASALLFKVPPEEFDGVDTA